MQDNKEFFNHINYFLINNQYSDLIEYVKNLDTNTINFTDEHGNNILHIMAKIASEKNQNNMVVILQILYEKKLDLTAVNSNFDLAIDILKRKNLTVFSAALTFYILKNQQKNKEYN